MIKITIIGSGNVAHHLIRAFQSNDKTEIVQVFARRQESVQNIIGEEKIISELSKLKDADLYIISVSDDVIFDISDALNFSDRLVVHTSGTKPIEILSDKNRKGVFYPLQTFSKSKEVNFKEIPICLEAANHQDLELLKKVANVISDKVFEIDSEKRKTLHVSAVFVSNFVNYLYGIGEELCKENDIPFDILKPLIVEVADKINYLSPEQAQTGPAKRGDLQTIKKHLELLKNDSQKKEIYKLLTQAIITKKMKSYKELMNDITTFVFDVDGVLTDGTVHVTGDGEILRNMNIRDGFAIKAALESGYNVCIISGGKNEGVRVRLRNLGVTDIYLGSPDKVETFKEYTDIYNIKPEQVLYMGDDIPDYHVMKLVGLPTCPQDAAPEIKSISNYISHVNGGRGAARDVIEQVMKVQGKWNTQFDGRHD